MHCFGSVGSVCNMMLALQSIPLVCHWRSAACSVRAGLGQSAPSRVTFVCPVCKVSQPLVCKWTQFVVANYVIITPGTQRQSESHKASLAHSHNTCLMNKAHWMFRHTEHVVGVWVSISGVFQGGLLGEFPWRHRAPQCKFSYFILHRYMYMYMCM